MNPDIKARWVAALRSGKYQQGQGYLRSSVRHSDGERRTVYCCLGVLTDILLDEIPDARWTASSLAPVEGESRAVYHCSGYKLELPPSIVSLSGVRSNGWLPSMAEINGAEYETLAQMNDEGVSFDDIADIIEERL